MMKARNLRVSRALPVFDVAYPLVQHSLHQLPRPSCQLHSDLEEPLHEGAAGLL